MFLGNDLTLAAQTSAERSELEREDNSLKAIQIKKLPKSGNSHITREKHINKKNKNKLKNQRREEEIEYTTEEEIFLPKPISRNGQLSFNNENKSIGAENET